MPIELYYMEASAPCRAVRLVAAAAGIELDLKVVNLFEQEQLKPEFIEMNPQHTIPTMNDDGFYLWESRAICTYLVQKYGVDDSLYPKDPQQRALVDQRLYFDLGTLYKAYADYYYPQVLNGQPPDPAKLEKVNEAFGYMEIFLEDSDYITGNQLTVADLVLVTTVSQLTAIGYEFSDYPNTCEWYKRIQSEATDYDEINEKGLTAFKELIQRTQESP